MCHPESHESSRGSHGRRTVSEEHLSQAGLELMEACKVALVHCGWMEASGYVVPPLPSGESLQDLLRAAMAKAVRDEWGALPKVGVVRVGELG